MTPELWKKVVDVLEALEPLDAPRRAVELERLRRVDPDAAREAASLLDQRDSTGKFNLDSVIDNVVRKLDWPDGAETIRQRSVPETVGPYRVVSEVGRGGMGVVYRARDSLFQRSLAVKVLTKPRQSDGEPDSERKREFLEMKRRFLAEATLMGQLQHPGIPPVHDRGELADDGRPYFVMKLIKGKTLATLLKERLGADQDHPRLLAIFEQVCQTLAYTHAQRIVHRDLKPANVMIGAFGEVQVMDWGLAKRLPRGTETSVEPVGQSSLFLSEVPHDATMPGQAMGTPAYMAPEQARGEEVDERSDVFGLGAILCEILTGQPPFTGRTTRELLEQAQQGRTEPALALLQKCSADKDLVILAERCLAVKKETRPANAEGVLQSITAHLAAAQERLRQAELARAQAEVRVVEEKKRRRLYRGLVILSVAALIVLSVLAGILFDKNNQLELAEQETQKKRAEADEKRKEAERERDRAEAMTYRAALGRIDMAAVEYDIFALQSAMLDSLPVPGRPDLRGLEWRLGLSLVNREVGGDLIPFRITTQAVSSDGKVLALAGLEAIQIRDLPSARLRISIDRQQQPLLQAESKKLPGNPELALSFDGSLLGVSLQHKPVTIWKNGTLLRDLPVLGSNQVAFTPDHKRFILAVAKQTRIDKDGRGDSEITFWDALTGEKTDPTIAINGFGPVFNFAFCASRNLVAVSTHSTVQIFDLATGLWRTTLNMNLSDMSFAPDGTYLAGFSYKGWHRWPFDKVNSDAQLIISTPPGNTKMAMSLDHQLLAISSGRRISITGYPTKSSFGPPFDFFAGHRMDVEKLLFTPGTNRLVSFDRGADLKIWQMDSAREVARFQQGDNFRAREVFGFFQRHANPVLAPDGHALLALLDDGAFPPVLTLCRSSGERLQLIYPAGRGLDVNKLAVSADGGTVAAFLLQPAKDMPLPGKDKQLMPVSSLPPSRLVVWTGLATIPAGLNQQTQVEAEVLVETPFRAIAVSADGTRLAAARYGGSVQLWDLSQPLDKKPMTVFQTESRDFDPGVLAFSKYGNLLALGGRSRNNITGDLIIWDLRQTTREPWLLTKTPGATISALAFAGDDRLAAGMEDGRIVCFNNLRDEPVPLLPDHLDRVTGLRFAPDGRTLASAAGPLDSSIKLWDVMNGQELITLQRYSQGTTALAFQKDGPNLLALSHDGRLRTWRALTEKQVYETVLREAAFEPDNPRMQLARVQACWGYGQDRHKAGDSAAARRLLEEGLQLLRKIPEGAQILPGPARDHAPAERKAWIEAFDRALAEMK